MEVKINRPTDIIKRRVKLTGKADIMFDRYAGDNHTKLEPAQKLYLSPGGSPVMGRITNHSQPTFRHCQLRFATLEGRL